MPRSRSGISGVNQRVEVVHIFVLYILLSVILKQTSRYKLMIFRLFYYLRI